MKILILIACLILFPLALWADEPVKYRVEVNITFNSVTPERAIAILREALEKAGGACQFAVKVSKGQTQSSGHIIYGWDDLTDNSIVFTPNVELNNLTIVDEPVSKEGKP